MEMDFADIKPTVYSWLMVGLMACTFIVLAKFVVNRWPVSGVTDLINAV